MSTGNELMELQAAFVTAQVRFNPLGLEIPEDLSKEDNAAVGRRLLRMDRLLQWYIGDWGSSWERKYGDLKEFCDMNGFNYQYVANKIWVSNAVAVSLRKENLEWSKYEAVAPLKAAKQAEWIAKAEAEGLTVSALRAQIRIAGGERNALQSDGPVVKFGLTKATDELHRQLTSQPEEFWSEERCAAVRELLKPIVEFYERLGMTGRVTDSE